MGVSAVLWNSISHSKVDLTCPLGGISFMSLKLVVELPEEELEEEEWLLAEE